MADPYRLQCLTLSGFRAYLQPKTFDFRSKRSLAIFAPNGRGKSSIIDALEFIFSNDGTLERLGQRAVHNQAGPEALAHNLAETMGVESEVKIQFVANKNTAEASRPTGGARRKLPEVVATVTACFVVSPIIRGNALRTFVENRSPEDRYIDVAKWLQLSPLVEVQKNVRALRTQVKAAADETATLQRVDTQIAKYTTNAVTTWDDERVISHVNTFVLAPLDQTLMLATLTIDDPAYLELEFRANAEANTIGLAGLRQIRNAAAGLYDELVDPLSGEITVSGEIPIFEMALAVLSTAAVDEANERSKSANNIFQTLWKAAEPFFADVTEAPDICPVCATPIKNTQLGSAIGVKEHLSTHLAELTDYATAKQKLDDARFAATTARTKLLAALSGLIGLLGDDEAAFKAAVVTYEADIKSWPLTVPPSKADVVAAIIGRLGTLDKEIADIQSRQGDHTYIKAKDKIDRLLELKVERNLAIRTRDELAKLNNALMDMATVISVEIREKLQRLLNTLQTPMNEIYKKIQGDSAKTIRLELPAEDDLNQLRLNLLIDFAENRAGVQPSGYLSDSQIHSVALSLRMAAIKLFNKDAPIIALDDIVTSYDADHRRSIAGLIASMFSDCQMLITTHDERFFNYLKDQLDENHWKFSQIISFDPSAGPRFADHKISDEMIQECWDSGKSAANAIRQAEEEWLLDICRSFGASVTIRPLAKAYSYERSELASALGQQLKKLKLIPSEVPGVNSRFIESLIRGDIENFGSHFQDTEYGSGSEGDEKTRWEEFKIFRSQFKCKHCSRTKFKRPNGIHKPVCAHESCEMQFAF